MTKSPDAFRTISEVADWLGVQAHVLRFWESKFSQVKPVKRAGGRRYYRPTDMQLLGGIKKLLHEDGMTIKGVQKMLREQGVAKISSLSKPLDHEQASEPEARTGETIEGTFAEIPDLTEAAQAVGDATPENTVVQFRSRPDEAEPAPPAAEEKAPAEADGIGGSEPEEAPEAPSAGDAFERATRSEDEPEPSPAPEAQEPEEQLTLPSFLHRGRSSAGASTGEAMGADRRPPEPPFPAPRVVDAPDPPAESEIPVRPGVMARLGRIERFSASQAAEIAPLAAELRAWLARAGEKRAG